MEIQYIENPLTGRKIMVGGPMYRRLAQEGLPMANLPVVEEKRSRPTKRKYGGPSRQRLERIDEMSVFDIPPLSELGDLADAPWKERRLEKLRKNVGKGRGSATRGWSLRAPQRGTQRHNLMKACGKKCFLGEDESFPICPSCELYEGDCQCEIDCDGANAAFVRARQWKYPEIADAAERILREKCNRNPQKGGAGKKKTRKTTRKNYW